MSEKNNSKILNAWCMYDWANSVHALVIVSTIFPPYFNSVAQNPTANEGMKDYVNFLGLTLKNDVLFSYSISFAFLLIVLVNPILTAIADYSGRKKLFMKIFVYLGSFSSLAMAFFGTEILTYLVFFFILSLVGYSGSIVFYNAYLPEIATEDRFDSLSARGFSMGYIGSVILLIFNLSMFLFPELYGGISEASSAKIAFICTGVWWFGFAQYTFYHLPKSHKKAQKTEKWLLNGFRELRNVLSELPAQKYLKRFLLGFFFYNMALQTVMYLAAEFGDKEVGLEQEILITTILVLQLLAIVGAYGFSFFSKKYGNIRALMIGISIWIPICIGALFIRTGLDFILIAVAIGFVMGGMQSLSRSTYAKLMPQNTPDKASYFGFYDVVDKLSIVLGTFSYGFLNQLFGSVRYSIVALAVFFVIGLIVLFFIPSKKSYH